jgi:hypothetical protein
VEGELSSASSAMWVPLGLSSARVLRGFSPSISRRRRTVAGGSLTVLTGRTVGDVQHNGIELKEIDVVRSRGAARTVVRAATVTPAPSRLVLPAPISIGLRSMSAGTVAWVAGTRHWSLVTTRLDDRR